MYMYMYMYMYIYTYYKQLFCLAAYLRWSIFKSIPTALFLTIWMCANMSYCIPSNLWHVFTDDGLNDSLQMTQLPSRNSR